MKYQKDYTKILSLIIIVAILLRVFFMVTTFNSDMLYRSYYSHFLVKEGVWNIYDYVEKNELCYLDPINSQKICYVYTPATYFSIGIYQFLMTPVSFGFEKLMGRFENLLTTYEHEYGSYVPDQENYSLLYIDGIKYLKWNLFLGKLPYLFFDVCVLMLLFLLFEKPNQRLTAVIFWAFNPISIYTSMIIANIDIILVFFVLLGCLLLKKRRYSLAALSVGVAATFKIFPIFFLASLAIIYGRSITRIIKYAIIGIIPLIVMYLPYLQDFNNYVAGSFSVGIGRPFPQYIVTILKNFLGIDISRSIIDPFIIVIVVFLFILFLKKPEPTVINYANSTLIICLIFFSFSFINLNYIMWAVPSFFFLMVYKPKYRKHIWVLTLLSIIIFNIYSGQKELTIGLFVPILPALYVKSQALIYYFNPIFIKISFIILRSIFSLLGIYLIYRMLVEIYPDIHESRIWREKFKKLRVP